MNRSSTGMAKMIRGALRLRNYGTRGGVLQEKNVLLMVSNADLAWLELGSRAWAFVPSGVADLPTGTGGLMDFYGHPQQMHLKTHLSGRGTATHVHHLVVEGDESRAELIEAHAWLHPIPEPEANDCRCCWCGGVQPMTTKPLAAGSGTFNVDSGCVSTPASAWWTP